MISATETNPTSGAGAALVRSAQAEKDLYDSWKLAESECVRIETDWRNAVADQDHENATGLASALKIQKALVKEGHAMWNATSKTFLGLEKGVKDGKRIDGNMISQPQQIENWCMLIRHLRLGVEKVLMDFSQQSRMCPTNEDVYELVESDVRGCLAKAVEQGIREERVPPFVKLVIEEEL